MTSYSPPEAFRQASKLKPNNTRGNQDLWRMRNVLFGNKAGLTGEAKAVASANGGGDLGYAMSYSKSISCSGSVTRLNNQMSLAAGQQ